MAAPVLLALRALNLGDLLTVVPALRALRRHHRDHRIVLATAGLLEPLAALTGAVDEVLPTPTSDALVFSGPVDVAVNLHGAGPQSHRALDALRPRRRIGLGRPELGWPGPPPAELDALHERVRWCAMLADHGIAADPEDLRLPPPADAPPGPARPVVVHPGAAFGAKCWPADRFAALAHRLAPLGPVVVTGGPPERPLAEQVAAAADLSEDRVLAGRTSIGELAALVAGAALVVSGDTGIAHLAAAFGRPSVVLFGPVGPERWGPPEGPHRALTHAEVRRGDPFAEDPDPALLAIEVDEVEAACLEVVGMGGCVATAARGTETP
ncbi:glycosyltransferase family 9 protein [Pseudonocardia sp. RS11V-5]|uniref:glycosyltransferase family 9 protein n=1 Tax=Pseudonocardia terrae TaxID=2905831 RepID=UPI001E5316E9|nr:glycosyltransferase family 9 protein [Pseudonocardia terrae]MCE3551714.1 glycosyltransferase family 9 protein [Pseudonocardia terrae]